MMLTRAAVVPAFAAEPEAPGVGRVRLLYVGIAAAGVLVHGSLAVAGTTSPVVDD